MPFLGIPTSANATEMEATGRNDQKDTLARPYTMEARLRDPTRETRFEVAEASRKSKRKETNMSGESSEDSNGFPRNT